MGEQKIKGGDNWAYHICEFCGHKMRFSIINPTEKEVWKWKKKLVCTICRKKTVTKRGNYKK